MLVTDMNAREREKFAKMAERTARMATKLAQSLREGDDDAEVLTNLVMLVLSGAFFRELEEIFRNSIAVEIPTDPAGVNSPAEPKKEES